MSPVIASALISSAVSLIGGIVTTAMGTSAAEEPAKKRAAAAAHQAAVQRAEMSRIKFQPKEVTPAPAAGTYGNIARGPQQQVDTGYVRMAGGGGPTMTAAERIKRRMQARRA